MGDQFDFRHRSSVPIPSNAPTERTRQQDEIRPINSAELFPSTRFRNIMRSSNIRPRQCAALSFRPRTHKLFTSRPSGNPGLMPDSELNPPELAGA